MLLLWAQVCKRYELTKAWSYDSGVFAKLVGEFVVDLVIGCPFVYICIFGLSQS